MNILSTPIDFSTIATPASGEYFTGFDITNNKLSKMDHNRVITLIGGGGIVKVTDFASLPGTGDVNFLYLTLNNTGQYEWDGVKYNRINKQILSLPDGTTLGFNDSKFAQGDIKITGATTVSATNSNAAVSLTIEGLTNTINFADLEEVYGGISISMNTSTSPIQRIDFPMLKRLSPTNSSNMNIQDCLNLTDLTFPELEEVFISGYNDSNAYFSVKTNNCPLFNRLVFPKLRTIKFYTQSDNTTQKIMNLWFKVTNGISFPVLEDIDLTDHTVDGGRFSIQIGGAPTGGEITIGNSLLPFNITNGNGVQIIFDGGTYTKLELFCTNIVTIPGANFPYIQLSFTLPTETTIFDISSLRLLDSESVDFAIDLVNNSHITSIDLSNIVINSSDNSGQVNVNRGVNLTNITLRSNPSVNFYSFQTNALTQSSVNAILALVNSDGVSNGSLYLDQGTNASPTGGASNTDKLALEGRGWTVAIN